ncbi:MAG: pyridoxal phosphate-dependent aminotransferase [Bacteroidales bacterium]|nr:pyridoxal phosphate-dependent aminotransferase [Bacteroidales bacterium]
MDPFGKAPVRRGTDCVKWDTLPEGVIPMWVADMDFETAPCVRKAVMERAAHGVYGYTAVPERFYRSVCGWFSSRHGWTPEPEWIIPTTGVVPAVSACIEAFTQPGDKVIIMTPVYNCFFSSIRNYGCETLDVPLKTAVRDGRPRYEVDFGALEKAAADPGAKVMLICSPHNPAGRVWTAEELRRMGEICLRNGVVPVVDEIHCEFVMPGGKFVPFGSLSQEFERKSVILNSPGKAFNMAGLQIACVFCADPGMRAKVDKAINVNEICDVNPFGVAALQAAYTGEGARWLDGLNGRIAANYAILEETAAASLPELPLYVLEGTYLAWMDIRKICLNPDGSLRISSKEVEQSLVDVEKVRLNNGEIYGCEGFLRINLACPETQLREGLERAVRGLRRLLEEI